MKNTLIILLFFLAGLLAGIYSLLPDIFSGDRVTLYVLYLLLFLVGVGVGANKHTLKLLRSVNLRIFLIPLSVIAGTLLGTMVYAMFDDSLTLRQCWAVGSGFGYYSLSSVLIKEIAGESLGVIALLSNIIREILTLVLSPLLSRLFGPFAPISSGGATSMDTTLPIITRSVGTEYAAISVFSGLVLTLLVPFLVPLILQA
ncbi:MAG: lysine exporter LysO family protein [Bacteroidales bacterium]|nr:lysine exporter LysO family protein [Bacteroidales bacterium]